MIQALRKANDSQQEHRAKLAASKSYQKPPVEAVNPKTPPQAQPPSTTTDEASDWSVVGSAKRKAKDSPTKTSAQAAIRKETPNRSAKKPLIESARDSTQKEPPAKNN
jgi:hypothetical protein